MSKLLSSQRRLELNHIKRYRAVRRKILFFTEQNMCRAVPYRAGQCRTMKLDVQAFLYRFRTRKEDISRYTISRTRKDS